MLNFVNTSENAKHEQHVCHPSNCVKAGFLTHLGHFEDLHPSK